MKNETIRARVSPTLKRRLAEHIEQQAKRGLELSESTVVVQATVEYLEKHGGNNNALEEGVGAPKARTSYPSGPAGGHLLNEPTSKRK